MPAWRPMRTNDIPAVLRLADTVHPGLPEAAEVFAERRTLFPAGCLVLATTEDAIEGYAVSHPIRRFHPPALNSSIGRIPADADNYYIHDFAVAPSRRGGGHAAAGVNRLLEVARGYPTTSLISVYGTSGFWGRFGFMPTDHDMGAKLHPYGADARYLLRDNTGHATAA